MTLCANTACRRTLHNYEWPGGTCSLACARAVDAMYDGDAIDENIDFDRKARPDRDAVSALQAAAEIHNSLPLALLLKARGWGLRRIAARVGCAESTLRTWLSKLRT